MQQEKSCNNCALFYRHYVKTCSAFLAINCGHCVHSVQRRKKIGPQLCEHWESNAEKEEQREVATKKSLEAISQRLSDILYVIKDDV